MAVSTNNNGSIARLYTLVYKLLGQFRVNAGGDIIGPINNNNVTLTQASIQAPFAPNNLIIGDGVKKITASITPPVSPQPGDLWIDIS